MSQKTVYDVERAKFDGFGKYKLDIEPRVNEILEATKKSILKWIIFFFGCALLIT